MVISHSSLPCRLLSFFRSLNVLQLDVLGDVDVVAAAAAAAAAVVAAAVVAFAARHYCATMSMIGRRYYKLHPRSCGAFSRSCDCQRRAIVSYIVLCDRSRERERERQIERTWDKIR